MALPPLKFDHASFLFSKHDVVSNSQRENSSQQQYHPHIIVQHDYHDRAKEVTSNGVDEIQTTRGGVTVPFPCKLHEMLVQVQEEGLEHIVSWQPHGRCFVVHDSKGFVEIVLPKYFKQSKLASFQRQLNLYGFQRLTKGNDKGGYYHEYFLRGRTDLTSKIHRIKIKGTGVRARSNPEAEPDLWQMSWMTSSAESPKNLILPVKTLSLGAALVSSDSSMDTTVAPASSSSVPNENNDTFFFEGKGFHAIEPLTVTSNSAAAVIDDDDFDFDDADIDSLLCEITIPEKLHLDIIDSIDDDIAFGNLLERLIDEQ